MLTFMHVANAVGPAETPSSSGVSPSHFHPIYNTQLFKSTNGIHAYSYGEFSERKKQLFAVNPTPYFPTGNTETLWKC